MLQLEARQFSPFDNGLLKLWTLQMWARGEFDPKDIPPDAKDPVKWRGGYIVSFDGIGRFHICFETQTVAAFDIAPETSQAALTHILFDHIAPRILAHLGELVLHGSAVEIAGKVAIFLGETGAGKSTLAASLGRAGHRLLGDDAVVVSELAGQFLAQPVYPSLRLYPDTIAALIDDSTPRAAMAHYSEKQRVELAGLSRQNDGPLPISALFLLSGEPASGSPAVVVPGPSSTCVKLLEQSFSLDPSDPACAARRLGMTSRLTEQVRAFELSVPHDYSRLDEAYGLIHSCIAKSSVAGVG